MRIEMDTFHPATSKVFLTRSEILNLFSNMRDKDTNVFLGYEDMDYEKVYAEYGSKEGRRKVRI